MGNVNAVLVTADLHSETWPYHNRLVIEDCETVHIHLNNMRLEFTREQFIELTKIFQHASTRLREIMELALA